MNLTQDQEQYAAAMRDHYVECALWSSMVYVDEHDEDGVNADEYHHSDELEAQALEDCREFVLMAYSELLASNISPEMAGHDLWLTRNHHGAGFWDRGYINGDRLTELACSMGSVDCYLGDNEEVYFS